ncbi:MAG TPA: GDP-mannose 4,6-dehydratase [Longimicrobium sp.]|uniref:GDP-mannose 4,6-dehydratase n=1 Tax=Longimicrobium sp. TaxID=2029185 RepID=UPI002EDA2CFA
MRVLVTGAAGFAGGWLLRALREDGHEVVAASQDGSPPTPRGAAEVEWIGMDVTSDDGVRQAVGRARPDVVYHLAGQASVATSFADPLGTWDVNATGTLRLAMALPRGTRLLVVSSAEVYGVVPEGEQPIAEPRPPCPCNPYAASKAAAELAALQADGVQVFVARAFNHTGPGQDARFAIASFAQQLAGMRGEADPVLHVGNLEARRDLLDVRDVVRGYQAIVERGEPGGVYNVCSGEAHSMHDVVARLVRISGTRARVAVDPERVRPVDLPLLLGDNARLRALGWAPRMPLEQTLSDLLDSFADEAA